jgi:hypothetical protein
MKTLHFVCMCLLLTGTASPAMANFIGIQIISEKYSVWGAIDREQYDFESTNSSGISGSVENQHSSASSDAERLSTGQLSTGASAFNTGISEAEASMLFQTVGSGRLHASAGLGIQSWEEWSQSGECTASLSDVTAGVTLFNIECVMYPQRPVPGAPLPHTDIWYSGDWLVDGTHQYLLSVRSFSEQDCTSGGGAGLSFTVPAPESAMLVLFGLSCLSAVKRRIA